MSNHICALLVICFQLSLNFFVKLNDFLLLTTIDIGKANQANLCTFEVIHSSELILSNCARHCSSKDGTYLKDVLVALGESTFASLDCAHDGGISCVGAQLNHI